eukprot:g1990.t1
MNNIILFAALIVLSIQGTHGRLMQFRKHAPRFLGNSSCPCKGALPIQTTEADCPLEYHVSVGTKQSAKYCYPNDYGSYCKAWDKDLPPACADENGKALPHATSGCSTSWCFVDPNECSKQYGHVELFEDHPQTYVSFETCGTDNAFKDLEDNNKPLSELVKIVDDYLISTRSAIQDAHYDSKDAKLDPLECGVIDGCKCNKCTKSGAEWGSTLFTTEDSVMYIDSKTSSDKSLKFKCNSNIVAESYNRIGTKEYRNHSAVGQMYYGDQESGGLVLYPGANFCPGSGYDPRFRPWYALAATGPKDILLILDVSGSMQKVHNGASRLARAKDAAKAVLRTLAPVDFVNVLAFSTYATELYSPTLVNASAQNVNAIDAWIDQLTPLGQTWYNRAFDKANEIFQASRIADATSGCRRIVLFLTDGEATSWKDQYMTDLTTWTAKYDPPVNIFTYAFGSDITDVSIPKSIACANEGVFQKVEETDSLTDAMSNYYSIFASAADICVSRWIEYKDAVTGTPLLTGCMPVYDRTVGYPKLLGATCMDISIIVPLRTLKAQADYPAFLNKYTTESKKCNVKKLEKCQLEILRKAISSQSVCSSTIGISTCFPSTTNVDSCTERVYDTTKAGGMNKEYYGFPVWAYVLIAVGSVGGFCCFGYVYL